MPDNYPTQPSPDWGFQFTEKARVNINKFGDGYSQRIPDGLNTILRTTNLHYSNLSTEDKDIIIDFLEDKAGITSFSWQPPGDPTPSMWYSPSWTPTPEAGRWDIDVEINEDAVP